MALVELAVFQDRMEAEIVRGRLAAEGIEAVLFDAGLSSLGFGGLAPARLMVEESQKGEAEAVLHP